MSADVEPRSTVSSGWYFSWKKRNGNRKREEERSGGVAVDEIAQGSHSDADSRLSEMLGREFTAGRRTATTGAGSPLSLAVQASSLHDE